MIRKIILILICLLGGWVHAQISFELCDPCDLTPMSGNQVMTGKQCTLRISSDANDLWSGGLFLSGDNRKLASLHGRDRDPNSRDWKGSHKEYAGPMAKVYAWNDSQIQGFDCYSSEYASRPGTWFLINYQALEEGECTISYYNHSCSWTQADPNVCLIIENIPNVDFYVDHVVDIRDFMVLVSWWLHDDCDEPDWCGQTDIDRDGLVDINDISVFTRYWLWGIAQTPVEPPAEPSNPPPPAAEPDEPQPQPEPDPNVIYSIYDANGLDDIVLETGQTVCLTVSRQTLGVNTNSFYLEAVISDPTAGWINNQEYDPNDPNDPNDPGRARILAQPRDEFFDYYGPGMTQWGGIQFSAVSFWKPIGDGPIASFYYTAARPGSVALMLVDYDSTPSRLEPIIIHQVEPGQTYSAPQDPNDMVNFLEDIWQTSPEIQQTTSWTDWLKFMEDVKSTINQ